MESSNPFLDKLVEDFVEWANGIEDCRSIVLYGSASRQERPADKYSDRDILVYIQDTNDNNYLKWIHEYAPVWVTVKQNRNLWAFVYQGGHTIHISVDPIERLQELVDSQEIWFKRSYAILLDKDGLAAKLPPPRMPSNEVPSESEFDECVQKFFYGTTLIAKQLRRGNLWGVKRDLGVQQIFMLEMIEWHAQTLDAVDTWNRGSFMQEWAREDVWDSLHGIFGHFDAKDSWRALFAMTRLFHKLAQETASQLNYTIPETVIDEVISYLEAMHSAEN